jgi:isopenicillin-N epimerase
MPELADQFLLRRDITFLNHGSFGSCPRPVFDTYQEWQRELERQPVEFLGRRLVDLLAAARERLATFVGTAGRNVVFVPNATFGVNIVAHSLDLKPGDEVLSTNHEYGAADRAWRFNCAQRGVRYVNHPISVPLTTPEAMIDQLWEGVNDRTRVIFVSHITSPTAVIFPVAEICARAREAGILTVIDGAHAPGQIDLDMDAIGADFYTGNCHKWLCAPKGAAFLYARPEQQDLLQPLVVSWGWESLKPGDSRFVDHFGWIGTHDPAAYLSVPAAIEFQEQNDWATVRAACHDLLAAIRSDVAARTGLPEICPDSTDWWSQMAVLPILQTDTAELHRHLWEEFRIEVPLTQWNGRQFVRVSIQAYSTPDDGARLIEALSAARAI